MGTFPLSAQFTSAVAARVKTSTRHLFILTERIDYIHNKQDIANIIERGNAENDVVVYR